MNANRATPGPSSAQDRQGLWLAVVSGERSGPAATVARLGLAALSGLYRAGLAVRNLQFRMPGAVRRAPCPVVSVGNLTVGGTGKTPMVAYLARLVVEMGGRPVIVSRGYGTQSGRPNEEAQELAQLCPGVPHIQNPDRCRALQEWAAANPCDLAILDDGFQHRRLARDLDIVLIDALRPFGFGRLLPRGLLREPVSALRRAGMVIITRAELADAADVAKLRQTLAAAVRPGTPVLVAEHRVTGVRMPDGSLQDASWLRGQDVAAACGIGNPDAFRRTLKGTGARVTLFDAYPDHHAYSAADLARLVRSAADAGLKTLVTTGKDYVKWRPLMAGLSGPPVVDVVAVEVAFQVVDGEPALRRDIGALLAGQPGLGGR